MVTSREIIEATPLGAELKEHGFKIGHKEGWKAGRAEGRAVGRAEGADALRSGIRALIESRWPSLPKYAWLDRVADPGRLEKLFRALLSAADAPAARAVLAKERSK